GGPRLSRGESGGGQRGQRPRRAHRARGRLGMPRRARLGDVLLVAAASLLLLLPTLAWSVVLGTPGALGTAGVVNAASGIIMTGALYWRQTHPAASAIAVYLGALSHLITGALWLPVDVLVLVALYSVTVHG